MFIKALEYNAISFIKNNITLVKEKLKTMSFEEILNQEFNLQWYQESKFVNPKIDFYMPKNVLKRGTDYENSKKVYMIFKNLTESQASDERLWSGLAILKENYDYLKYRWEDTEKTLRYRVVYHASSKRGFMYHGLARLWWFAHITYDENRENEFELTEFTFNHPHILEKMIYRNFSNSKNIRIGIIEGVQEYINLGGIYRVKKIDELYKHISTLGSVSLIDNYSQNEIKQITIDVLKKQDEDANEELKKIIKNDFTE